MVKAVLLVLCAMAAAAADPDFTGEWRLNKERSNIRSLPVAPCEVMKIEHREDKLISTGIFGPCSNPHPPLFTAGRKETRALSGDTETRMILKWEGDALLFNTVVNGHHGTIHTQMDRWQVSRDGKTLRIRREIVSRNGEIESELVYERQLPPGGPPEGKE